MTNDGNNPKGSFTHCCLEDRCNKRTRYVEEDYPEAFYLAGWRSFGEKPVIALVLTGSSCVRGRAWKDSTREVSGTGEPRGGTLLPSRTTITRAVDRCDDAFPVANCTHPSNHITPSRQPTSQWLNYRSSRSSSKTTLPPITWPQLILCRGDRNYRT